MPDVPDADRAEWMAQGEAEVLGMVRWWVNRHLEGRMTAEHLVAALSELHGQLSPRQTDMGPRLRGLIADLDKPSPDGRSLEDAWDLFAGPRASKDDPPSDWHLST